MPVQGADESQSSIGFRLLVLALLSLQKTFVVPPDAATPTVTFDHKNIRTISCYVLIVIIGLVNPTRGIVL